MSQDEYMKLVEFLFDLFKGLILTERQYYYG